MASSGPLDPSLCAVCTKEKKKYKCPRCETPYCSLSCFKAHKEGQGCDGKAEKATGDGSAGPKAAAGPLAVPPAASNDLSITEHPLVSDDEMLRMQSNPKLLNMLRDRRLQEVIKTVDGARDRAAALEQAKQRWGKDFAKFLDEMLVSIGACVRRPDGSVEFVK